MDLHSPVCAWYTWFGSVPSSPVGESDSAVTAEMMAVMANVDTAAAISMHATPHRDVMLRSASRALRRRRPTLLPKGKQRFVCLYNKPRSLVHCEVACGRISPGLQGHGFHGEITKPRARGSGHTTRVFPFNSHKQSGLTSALHSEQCHSRIPAPKQRPQQRERG